VTLKMPNRLDELKSKGLRALAQRQFHEYYDSNTYGNEKLFEGFKASKDQNRFLKLLWAWQVDWPCNKVELAKICPDVCPIFGTPLDYGRGLNRVINPLVETEESFFQPSVDHKVPRSIARDLGWTEEQINDISNYVIISRQANQMKSNMSTQEELDAFYQNIKKVYFS
jgi:hypothetical protein